MMGYLEKCEHVEIFYRLHLTNEDAKKREQRIYAARQRMQPAPTRHEEQFMLRLEKCPYCSKAPRLLKVRLPEGLGTDYKASCDLHEGSHGLECGDWFRSVSHAGRDWNERVRREKLDPHEREIYGLLWVCRHQLTRQQIRTLKGQIFSGNADAALRGLNRILKGDLPEMVRLDAGKE